MNGLSSSSPLIVVFFVLLCTVAVTVTSAYVTPVTDTTMTRIQSEIDFQSINSITIDPLCREESACTVPAGGTLFTIVSSEEGEGVTVDTSPANLVTATTWRNTLNFEWNADVVAATVAATNGEKSHVRIGVPSDQLLSVSVMDGQTAEVLEGFTNITYVVLTGADSVLRASMTSLIATELELDNDGGSMYVETNIPVTDGYVSDGGQSWVSTPSFNGIFLADDGSQLNIDGDIDVSSYNGFVGDGSQLTVTGTITGSIDSFGSSTVNTPNCENVISSDNSICSVGPQSVDVDVGDLVQNNDPTTLDDGGSVIETTGEESSSSSSSSSPDSIIEVSASVMPSYVAAIIAAVVAVATTATFM
mmetsp:Transcript_44766/g.50194  ORF Transcript_44766/g.50194 Transcript_44766/m.50194 type:complete len:361 (+) Transcript_44766:85-1167(+)